VPPSAEDKARTSSIGDALPASGLERPAGTEQRHALWRQIQDRIKDRLGLKRYGIWFNQTELMNLDRASLVVGVPNVIIKQYLDHQYKEIVREEAEALLGKGVVVRFDVAPGLLRRDRARKREVDGQAEPQRSPEPSAEPPRTSDAATKAKGFAGLVITEHNQLPLLAAREIACRDNPRFHFLLVLGDHGVGKTALLRAARDEARMAGVLTRGVEYETAETWCNNYFHTIQTNQTRAFRHKYRSCSMFLLDGIEFLQGKPAAQDEMVFTVKELLSSGGRAALSSATLPEHLQDVQPAFRTLLTGAFRVRIEVPPLPERKELAKGLARLHSLHATEDVFDLLAESYCSSIEELNGAILSLAAYGALKGCKRVDFPAARAALSPSSRAGRRHIGMEDIAGVVLDTVHVSKAELTGATRTRSACRARHLGMYLAKQITGCSLSEIGRFFGGRNHSTVKHALDEVEKRLQSDPQMAALVEHCRSKLL